MNSARHSAQWIPLMDYAMKKGVSLSTLRRHIKANKISYKIENGKYLLPDEGGTGLGSHMNGTGATAARESMGFVENWVRPASPKQNEQVALQLIVDKLQQDLQRAHEEIAELKTLIALYEERMPNARLDV